MLGRRVTESRDRDLRAGAECDEREWSAAILERVFRRRRSGKGNEPRDESDETRMDRRLDGGRATLT
jgi:hypothetical protein